MHLSTKTISWVVKKGGKGLLNLFQTILGYDSALCSLEIMTYRGNSKGREDIWTEREIFIPSAFRNLKKSSQIIIFFCIGGEACHTMENMFFGSTLLSTMPDNEGITFVTKKNSPLIGDQGKITLHRLYKDNWFFLGFQNLRPQNHFSKVGFFFLDLSFTIQGDLYLKGDFVACKKTPAGEKCTRRKQEIYLLDQKTNSVKPQPYKIRNIEDKESFIVFFKWVFAK